MIQVLDNQWLKLSKALAEVVQPPRRTRSRVVKPKLNLEEANQIWRTVSKQDWDLFCVGSSDMGGATMDGTADGQHCLLSSPALP